MRFRKISIIVMLLTFAALAANAQTPQVASVYHDVHKIQSKVLNEERSIWVRVPLDYGRTDSKFPVVYMLDGHAPQPSMMAGIIEQQAWGGTMPEMILVSIQNTNRSRDLTPTDDGKGGNVGGGAKFLRFIEQEVIPLVEKHYRTQPFRIFAGHSLGGLFVVYSMVSLPDLFNAYIAASPVLGYDNNYVIKEADKLFEEKRDWNKIIFLGIGDEPQYIEGFNNFRKLLEKTKPRNFEFKLEQFKDDNHVSVVLPIYYAGLRMIFDGWQPPKNGSILGLENHYKKLSKRFGYEILIPEATINQIGYQLLNAKSFDEAISAFRKNVQSYPNSANVYDSLGDAFEKNGQLKQAAENYEKAFKLAETLGDKLLADRSKASLNRVSGKIK